MPTFDRGDVVRVPFPYTDRSIRQNRPALVVSRGHLPGNLLWVLMITSADNPSRTGDVAFGREYRSAGLPAPSVVRSTKIATVEISQAERLGRTPPAMMADIDALLAATLGLQDPRRPLV